MTYPTKQSPEQWAAQLNFDAIETKHGLPKGVLTNLVRQESSGNCNAKSAAGAQGLCQFMPATAKQYGVDVTDPVSSVNGAARYLEDLMDLFDGDSRKAIAAYNCGQGRLGKIIKQYGDAWDQHLPSETADYLNKVSRGIGQSFVQRQENHSVTREEEEREAVRRRAKIREAGFDASEMPMGDLLGVLFFALVKGYLQKKFDDLEKNGQERGPAVLPPESVSPSENHTPSHTPRRDLTTQVRTLIAAR